MTTPKSNQFDPDLIRDLKDELDDKRQACNDHLLRLEHSPDDMATINLLFRDVHTVKGDLGIMGINQYIPLLQSIEDVLDNLRKGEKSYNAALGDVLLLCLDLTFTELDNFVDGQTDFNQDHYNHVADLVHRLSQLNGNEADQQTLAIIQHLAPETAPVKELQEKQSREYFTEEEVNEEVAFFLQLSLLVDLRTPYGRGRTERLFELGMTMNQLAGNPIPSSQLQAALYLHDIGMAFVPKRMISKASALSLHDWTWIKNHVTSIHQLIEPFDVWGEAAQIILHHHERLDGTGYPNQLTEENICEGAKLLAIVDTFEAITQTRSYQENIQRPMMRAILEINQQAGKLFCPKWVEHFNQAVKRLHVKKAKK